MQPHQSRNLRTGIHAELLIWGWASCKVIQVEEVDRQIAEDIHKRHCPKDLPTIRQNAKWRASSTTLEFTAPVVIEHVTHQSKFKRAPGVCRHSFRMRQWVSLPRVSSTTQLLCPEVCNVP